MSDMSMGGVGITPANMVRMEIGAAVLKKGMDVAEQQGQNMLKLVESIPSPSPQGSLGHNLDVKA